MAISTEMVNTTFANLRGPMVNAFKRRTPFWKALDSKFRMPAEGGTYIERTFMGSAPARGVGMFNGDELLNMTRRQQTHRYRIEPHRLVIAVNIPKKEMLFNTGKLAVMKIIEEYPKATVDAAICDLNQYLMTGVSRGLVFQTAEMAGFMPLNGDFTSGIGLGVTNGLLDFATPTAQAAAAQSVQNVVKSTAYFHYNQYFAITTWLTNGMDQIRAGYRACSHWSDTPPDLVVMDDDVYGQFEKSKLANVRITLVEDETEKTDMTEQTLGMAAVYSDLDLDRSLFAAPGSGGVTYILNSKHMEFVMHEAPNITSFEERLGDQDVITAIWAMMGGFISDRPISLGCISGGAT